MSKKWNDKMVNELMKLYDTHTYEEIANKINKKFGSNHTPNAVRKTYERNKYPVIDLAKKESIKKPKVLLFDIETMPMEAYVWSMFPNYIPLNMIKEDWSVLSYAAKWMDEDEVFYESIEGQRNQRNDKKVLKKIWKLLDEADIVVGHNSDSFDVKKLNARFLMNDMKPPSSYKRMDTKKMAKKYFAFTSNKLEYLTNKLCKEQKKSKHNEFPGFQMWLECINRNSRAFNSMKEYNILDVTSLEELFKIMLPWESSNVFGMYNDSDKPVCSCGNDKFKKDGFYYTNAAKYQKYRCTKCGAEHRDSKNLATSKKRTTKR